MSTHESRDAHATASNPQAPAAERLEAETRLAKAHMPSSSDIAAMREGVEALLQHAQAAGPSRAALQAGGSDGFADPREVRRIAAEQQLAKALSTEDAFLKAARILPAQGLERGVTRAGAAGMHSVNVDATRLTINGSYIERPGLLTFDVMRAMVKQTPILSGIVGTRIRQVQRYCSVPITPDTPGFVVALADKDAKQTPAIKKRIQELQGFFLNCGWETNPRRRTKMGRADFSEFISKHVRDSLSMDSAPIETEMKNDRSRGIDGFYPVDGATIRLCTEDGYDGDDRVFALQVVQGQVRTAFDYDSLIYKVRNPDSDIMSGGYGLAEPETLIKVATAFLNAMQLNMNGFTDNSIPKGVLTLFGDFQQAHIDDFTNRLQSMVSGVGGAWRLPVLAAKGGTEAAAKFEKFGVDFDEMMFKSWMTFLNAIACAIYQMAPEEINFESFSANKSSLSGSDTAEKVTDSKDRGFRPLMAHLQSEMDYMMADLDEGFVFRWSGLDPKDQEKEHENRKLVLNVDELRAQMGLEPLPATCIWRDAPLNPALIPAWQTVTIPPPPGAEGGPDPAGGGAGQPGKPRPPGGGAMNDPDARPNAGAYPEGAGDDGDPDALDPGALAKALRTPSRTHVIGW